MPRMADPAPAAAPEITESMRDWTVSHLFLAGCTEAEIATITGHSLHDVRSILDANYFHRDVKLVESGIAKLEKSRASKTPIKGA